MYAASIPYFITPQVLPNGDVRYLFVNVEVPKPKRVSRLASLWQMFTLSS